MNDYLYDGAERSGTRIDATHTLTDRLTDTLTDRSRVPTMRLKIV
jgi:hypothetical protein